jgi:hypothetical protein
MDPIPLVAEQIEDGRKLVARLMQEGFPVTAACWVKESDGGLWYLYLVSPVVDSRGPREGYRRVHAVIRQMPPFQTDRMEVKLIGPTEAVAKAITSIRDRSSGRGGTWYDGSSLGMLPIDTAYLYAPLNGSRSSGASPGVA